MFSRLSLIGAALVPMLALMPAEAVERPTIDLTKFTVPDVDSLPDDAYGRLVRKGRDLVTETYKHIGPEVKDKSKRYAGNNLACSSCHLQGGTVPYAMPYTGVTKVFPQYRAREDAMQTVEDRVNGCLERSMAGRRMPDDSPEMKAYMAYFDFLSRDLPKGATIIGAGVKLVKMPDRMADWTRGEVVFKEQCATCHGEDGAGVRNGAKGDAQGYAIPPAWGADSYNQGAGMYRLAMATRFVLHNMPQGTTHDAPQLSLDDAYDVMAYVNTQARMAKTGMEKDFPNLLRKPADMPFAPYVDQFSQAQHKYGPFAPIAAELARMQKDAEKK